MPTERVTRILLSKTDLTPVEIGSLSESQAWNRVYSVPPPKRDDRLEICFTGFGATDRSELESVAQQRNLRVVRSVTKRLGLLVCGPNAGEKKIEKAAAQGVHTLDGSKFAAFLETGEVPDA